MCIIAGFPGLRARKADCAIIFPCSRRSPSANRSPTWSAQRYSCRSFDGRGLEPEVLADLEKFPAGLAAALCQPAPLRRHRQGKGPGREPVLRRQLRHDQGGALLSDRPGRTRTSRAAGRTSASPWRRRSCMPPPWSWAAAGSAASFDRKRFGRALGMGDGRAASGRGGRGPPGGQAFPARPPGALERQGRPAQGSGRAFFSTSDWRTPLPYERSAAWAPVLECVRLAPSASNKQPWRVVRQGGAFHFFLSRDKAYGALMPLADLQRIDMGIAMCHFQLAAAEAGLEGEWSAVESQVARIRPANFEYIVSVSSLLKAVSWRFWSDGVRLTDG